MSRPLPLKFTVSNPQHSCSFLDSHCTYINWVITLYCKYLFPCQGPVSSLRTRLHLPHFCIPRTSKHGGLEVLSITASEHYRCSVNVWEWRNQPLKDDKWELWTPGASRTLWSSTPDNSTCEGTYKQLKCLNRRDWPDGKGWTAGGNSIKFRLLTLGFQIYHTGSPDTLLSGTKY